MLSEIWQTAGEEITLLHSSALRKKKQFMKFKHYEISFSYSYVVRKPRCLAWHETRCEAITDVFRVVSINETLGASPTIVPNRKFSVVTHIDVLVLTYFVHNLIRQFHHSDRVWSFGLCSYHIYYFMNLCYSK